METLRRILRWIAEHRILSIFLFLLVAGGGIYARILLEQSQGVLSDPLEQGTIIESVYGIGTVTALRSYQIRSGITSTIYDLYVNEGASVPKGSKLINMDGQIYKAPFDGTVTSVPYKMGENIFANMSVLTIVDLKDRYLVVSLEQQAALRVHPGQPVRLSFDTQRDKGYSGTVESVYSNETGFLARINVASLPDNILPGMTADVAISIRQKDNALLAPVAGLEEGKFLWVKRPHQLVKEVEVKTGIIDKALVEVVSGDVHAGDQILIRKQP